MLFDPASEIEVNIVEAAPRENLARLRAEQLDIAFVMGEPVARDCDVVRFWSEHVFIVLPDRHALCAKDAIAWEDLRNEHFILSRSERGLVIHDCVQPLAITIISGLIGSAFGRRLPASNASFFRAGRKQVSAVF